MKLLPSRFTRYVLKGTETYVHSRYTVFSCPGPQKVAHVFSTSYTQGNTENLWRHNGSWARRSTLTWLWQSESGLDCSFGFRCMQQIGGYRARRHSYPGKSLVRSLFWKLSRSARIRGPKRRVPAAGFRKHGGPASWKIVAIPSEYAHDKCGVHA